MDLNHKRKYIFHKIESMKDTSDLYNLVDKMDIPKTTNSNGIFMNLSALSSEDVQSLYEFMETIHIHKEEFIPKIEDIYEGLSKTPFEPPQVKKTPPVKKMQLTSLQKTILSYDILT